MTKVKVKPKSWQYTDTVAWTGSKKGRLTAEGKPDLDVATPPDFGGHEGIWSPEDLFVAAVNCCIMTTFLYYRAKTEIELVSYRSTAEGTVEFGEEGLAFTRVKVNPEVVVASARDRKKTEQALQKSERRCLISNSLGTAVVVEPQIEVAPAQDQASGV